MQFHLRHKYLSATLIGLSIGSFTCVLALFFLFAFRPADPPPSPTLVFQIPVVLESPTSTATASHTPTASQTASTTPRPTVTASHTPTASATPSPDPCQPPADWIQHQVEAGETLFAFQLGVDSAVTVDEIIAKNCLKERLIYEGQVIWLPQGAVENAPASETRPSPYPDQGLTRLPKCPCEITIPQAWRLEQIAELVDSLPLAFRGSDFLAAARRSYPEYAFLAGASSLEGFIFPSTYTLGNESSASDFVRLALDQFGAATGDFWAARSDYTPYQLVILASIINRESRSPAQQVLISSVFHNRLKSGRGLAASVTLQYALGKPGAWWGNVAGLISSYDSPYNTNIYGGFPPSPIASPSLDALRAAVYPAESNYLFFTASCTGGGNAFAETYEQHRANAKCE